MDDIKFMTGYNVEPVVASETARSTTPSSSYYAAAAASGAKHGAAPTSGASALDAGDQGARGDAAAGDAATSRCSRSSRRSAPRRSQRQGEEAPVIKLVNVILMSAIQKGASDIHIEPYEKEFRVRLPRRRHPLQHHGAADEVPRCDHLAHQDHGEARHRREAPAAGRPHQDPLRRQRRSQGHRLPRLAACRRSSARRSSCVCSTRTS